MLYADEVYSPPEALPDFRRLPGAETTKFSVQGNAAISDVKRYLKIANVLAAAKPVVRPISGDDVEEAASRIRSDLSITDSIQLGLKNRLSLFRYIRNQIEKLNVFVFGVSAEITDFRGFCIEQNGYWAIAFNTADENHGARSFTLVHEYTHIALGKPGVSGSIFEPQNKIERFCNKVAAIALAPGKLLKAIRENHYYGREDKLRYVNYFANKIGLSRHMTAIRLRELGIIDKKYFEEWISLYERRPDGLEYGDGGGAPPDRDEGKYKIAKFGAAFALLVTRAVLERRANPMELSKLIGLKKKYIKDTYEAALEALR